MIDFGKLSIRLLFGISLALNHGWPTIIGLLNGSQDFPDPLGMGPEIAMPFVCFAEFVCVIFIIAGLFTRLFAILVIINFLVAVIIYHFGDPFSGKELAFLYLSAFFTIFLLGPGRYSLDYKLFWSD